MLLFKKKDVSYCSCDYSLKYDMTAGIEQIQHNYIW